MTVLWKNRKRNQSHKNTVIIYKTVRAALQETGIESNDNDAALLNLKPDIIIHEANRMIILDIACPYDLYLEELYQLKSDKYRELQSYIKEKFMPCKIDAILIGSLGIVHKNAHKAIMDTGLCKKS